MDIEYSDVSLKPLNHWAWRELFLYKEMSFQMQLKYFSKMYTLKTENWNHMFLTISGFFLKIRTFLKWERRHYLTKSESQEHAVLDKIIFNDVKWGGVKINGLSQIFISHYRKKFRVSPCWWMTSATWSHQRLWFLLWHHPINSRMCFLPQKSWLQEFNH